MVAVPIVTARTDVYGAELLGPFVISCVKSGDDVLSRVTLARAGWLRQRPANCAARRTHRRFARRALPFLTICGAAQIYREHLATCNDEQMIMIGYSDSNKGWRAMSCRMGTVSGQENITKVAQKIRSH